MITITATFKRMDYGPSSFLEIITPDTRLSHPAFEGTAAFAAGRRLAHKIRTEMHVPVKCVGFSSERSMQLGVGPTGHPTIVTLVRGIGREWSVMMDEGLGSEFVCFSGSKRAAQAHFEGLLAGYQLATIPSQAVEAVVS